MKVAIMQPYLFPYIGYWQLLDAVDTFVIFDDVNFIKKGYINKNAILVGGREHKFTLELKKASQNRLINEIEVGGNQGQLLKTISMAYKKASCFKMILPLLEEILGQDEKNLARYVGFSLMEIAEYLEIEVKFIYSSEIDKNNSLKGQDKIIDLIKILGATDYVNAIGGRELYEKAKFDKENIKINFIETEIVKYNQFDNGFIPYLSIIDILMFNSVEETKVMLGKYQLI